MDHKIPVTVFVTIALQTALAIWWAAQLDTRVSMQERWVQDNTELPETIARLEERIIHLQDEITEINELESKSS